MSRPTRYEYIKRMTIDQMAIFFSKHIMSCEENPEECKKEGDDCTVCTMNFLQEFMPTYRPDEVKINRKIFTVGDVVFGKGCNQYAVVFDKTTLTYGNVCISDTDMTCHHGHYMFKSLEGARADAEARI